MITADKVTAIGKLKKPHGYKGELGADIFYEKDIFEDSQTPFFIKIDNILVPFFVEGIGGGPYGTGFIKFKDVDSDADGAVLSKKDLYVLKSFMAEYLGVTEEELEAAHEDFSGYIVYELDSSSVIGRVEGIMEGIEYDYLIVEKENSQGTIEIPLVDEFISEIKDNPEGKGEIIVNLPSGFLEI